MKKININELKPEYNIIDIRSYESYNLGHIYNARNIDMNLLINYPEKYLNKNETYYIYCKSGYRSNKCCLELSIKGYDVVDAGGYDDYF